MSEPKDVKEVKRHILGYGYMLEEGLISEFKRLYPDIIMKKVVDETVKQTERPTIDISDYDKKPGIVFHTNSSGASYFMAEPGFRPRPKVPSGRKIISFIDKDGLIRYKYDD